MNALEEYLDYQLEMGHAYFSKEEAQKAVCLSPAAFTAAATRLSKRHRLISPWRGFYLILRPEDRVFGAPDPVRWIDPLMKYFDLDYRISLLRAAAFHGSSHQASMNFQLVVPKQLRSFDLGRQRIEFVYLAPQAFTQTNRPEWLQQIKSDAGFAKMAGIELTLLDSTRYFHRARGINGVAQIVHDSGGKASPHKLEEAARSYENSAVRRLGYLLEHFGHKRQAKALMSLARKAKSMKSLDPSISPLIEEFLVSTEQNKKWMLSINEVVEIDS